MSYATGQIINHIDYNTFATGTAAGTPNNAVANVNTVWGVGNGAKGYGQTNTLSPVATSNIVTATQWATMFSKISTSANLQGTTITSLPTPTTGNLIAAVSGLSSNITAVFNGVGKAAATSIGNTAAPAFVSSPKWVTALTFTFGITFASGDAARYFFNAGGSIQFSFARTGAAAGPKDTDWTALCAACGTANFGYNSTTRIGGSTGGATSAVPPIALGYWQVTTTAAGIQFQTSNGSAPYSGHNSIGITAKSNGAVGSNGDRGNLLTFVVTWTDNSGSDTTGVTGTSTTTAKIILPNPSGITSPSSPWGAPTFNTATVSGS